MLVNPARRIDSSRNQFWGEVSVSNFGVSELILRENKLIQTWYYLQGNSYIAYWITGVAGASSSWLFPASQGHWTHAYDWPGIYLAFWSIKQFPLKKLPITLTNLWYWHRERGMIKSLQFVLMIQNTSISLTSKNLHLIASLKSDASLKTVSIHHLNLC